MIDRQHYKGIDFLKVISAFAVIWLHVSAPVVMRNPDINSSIWWIGNFADAFSRWCVPIFVMVSGFLSLPTASKFTPFQFYQKQAYRLLPPLILWTIVFIVFRKYTEVGFSRSILVENMITGQPSTERLK